MYDFEFVRPASLAEAIKAMGQEGAQALSGGQTLVPTMKQRLAAPERLVSLTGIAELKGVSAAGGQVTIGGATCHADVAAKAAAHYPGLAALAGQIGDPAVRNRGTIGGSLATALEEGEIVTAVRFPIPQAAGYAKFAQPASRFALVGVFVARFADGVRVAVTGASNNGVFRWTEAEAALSGNFSADAVKGLTVPADDMIADLHGSAEYRAHLVGVMTGRAVKASV